MKRVLVSNSDSLIEEMFRERGWEVANSIESCDLVVFSGGADINPFIYGERPLEVTRFSTARDNMEIGLWKTLPPKFPKVGICRGAQLGNVLCGGTLWQHVDNHGSRHPIKDLTGIAKPHLLVASSVHHQMCRLTSDASCLLLRTGQLPRRVSMNSLLMVDLHRATMIGKILKHSSMTTSTSWVCSFTLSIRV